MADKYINELEINGQKRLDLTQDTATPETVLEGETFHLRSGAPATGTYRPSDEIEARLRATVGHSSKNLLKITADSQTINGVTFTVDKTAGTITVNGQVSSSATMAQLDIVSRRDVDSSLNGLILTEPASKTIPNYGFRTAIAYYNSSGTYISEQVINSGNPNPVVVSVPSNAYTYKVYVRATTSAGTMNNLIVTPMLRETVISDDTFEPYVTPTDELIARLDQRIYELERINEKPTADPDEGEYFITVFNDFGSDCDIWLTTPIADGGAFYDKYVYSHWVTTYHRPLDYCGKRIMVLFRAGTGDIVMTLNSSQSGQGRFYKQFDVDTFLDMCDVKDGSATNYISIHLCDDGGIRSQAEYEAYIGS